MPQSERMLYQLLREWLSRQEGGSELLADFERKPEEAALRLRDFLVRTGAALPPTLATYVSGGRVEKLVNIARTESVHFHLAEAEPTLTPEERQDLERRYLERVAEECRYLETEGVDRARAELTDVFVMLEAVESPRREAEADVAPVPERVEEMGLKERAAALFGHRQAEPEKRAPAEPPALPVPLSQALGAHTHLVILGEPGTGKTTTLQFVALCFATDGWAKDRLDLDEARVPVRVALREYDGAERLDRFFIQWLDRAYVPEALAQDWLTGGRLAILLDGLDEVPEARRAAVVEAIERFATTPEGRRCRIVVTSRIAGYRGVQGLGAEFGHYTIRPFTGPQDALPYAAGWLRALQPAMAEAAEGEAQALFRQMEGRAGLRRVMGNPLLLRLAVAVYVETGQLARSRAELYRRYVEEVTWKRAEAREQPRWNRQQVEEALEAVAWALQMEGQKTTAGLAEVVGAKVEGVADGQELLDYLREQLGLLAVYGYKRGELIAFRHLTFREYFVARRVYRQFDRDARKVESFLLKRVHHPEWREPILLLMSLIGETKPSQVTRLLEVVLTRQDAYEDVLHRNLVFAGTCLTGELQIGTALQQRIIQELVNVYLGRRARKPSQRLRNEILGIFEGLQGTLAGTQVIETVHCIFEDRSWEWLRTIGRALSLRCIVKSGWLGLLPLLARDWHFHVRLEAVEVLGELKHVGPDVLSWLQLLLHDREDFFRREAVSVLGSLGASGVAVKPLLLQACNDEDEYARRRALEALGQLPLIDAKVMATLVSSLKEEGIAYAAKEALKTMREATPDAVAILVPEVQNEVEDVQLTAITALGNLGQSTAEVIDTLLDALHDNKYLVRQWAAEALGKLRKSTPETVASLLNALDDEDELVGLKAAIALARLGQGDVLISFLLQALSSESSHMRWEAASYFGIPALAVPQFVDALTPIFRDTIAQFVEQELDDEDVKAIIRLVLATAPEPETEWSNPPLIDALLAGLRSEDITSLSAARALGSARVCTGQVVEALLDSVRTSPGFKTEVTKSLSNLVRTTPAAVEPLLAALRDRNPDVQQCAVEALGDTSFVTPGILRALLRTLNPRFSAIHLALTGYEDPDHSGVREEAAKALGKLGDLASDKVAPRVVKGLIRALKNCYLAGAAAEALARLGSKLDLKQCNRAATALHDALGKENFFWSYSSDTYDTILDTLDRIAARITELEVAALGTGPPLFATAPVGARPSLALPIVLGTLIAALSGVASNIVAAYLQDRYRLITNAGRFGVVMAVFVLTLVASIWLALRRERGTAGTAERH